MSPTPFEEDIAAQPEALRELADTALPDLGRLDTRGWNRIVVTGMGSSHFAGIPTWRSLVGLGHAAWSIDTGRLLDSPDLVTPETLLIVTSQSGASGEIVRLIEHVDERSKRPAVILAMTAEESSPLAEAADILLPLRSGREATVSTKSYLNTLAAHRRLIAAFTAEPDDRVRADIEQVAEEVARTLETTSVGALAEAALADDGPRLVTVGKGDSAATALYTALIVKEAAKLPVEGYIGGQFRHGPYELAGPGLTAFLYGELHGDDCSLRNLADDLVASGSRVVTIGDGTAAGTIHLGPVGRDRFRQLVLGSVVSQLLAVRLAEVKGVTPGEFRFGSKVTTAI